MQKQSERIFKEYIIAKFQKYCSNLILLLKALTAVRVVVDFLKKPSILKKGIIFALKVPVLLPIRTASGSFLKEQFSTQDNTPPMPLLDAHLGGFLIL